MHKRLLLVDGSALVYKAFYALGKNTAFTTSKGDPTNALFGFHLILKNVCRRVKPSHVLVAFDEHAPTLRHQKYPAYKAQRKPAPEELVRQLPLIREMLTLQGIKWFATTSWEADDIIATATHKARQQGFEVIVLSPDQDLLQLVAPHVECVTTHKAGSNLMFLTVENFWKIKGFRPHQMLDYKSLVGDTADNLPGVPGVGPKTAVQLLTRHKCLDEIYKNLSSLPKPLRIKLEKGQKSAFFSREMTKLFLNVELPFAINDFLCKVVDTPALASFYAKHEMFSLLKNLRSQPSSPTLPRILF